MATLGVLKEKVPGENRVAMVPEVLPSILKYGLQVCVESGAGINAGYFDEMYDDKGAKILPTAHEVLKNAHIVCLIHPPRKEDIAHFVENSILISLLYPLLHLDLVKELAAQKLTVFSLDLIPRISRAQSMDPLSSQSTVSGYKALIMAANTLPKFLPMLTTPAGTIPPCKVFVIGAGVAGLQAIATARRLGALVEAYDIRPVAKEQVESLGAKFVNLPITAQDVEDRSGYAKAQSEEFYSKQRQLIIDQCKKADIVITTALVPGVKAPKLIAKEAVEMMKPGSVIVDLAAEQGGNCELTVPGKTVVQNHVIIHGPLNIASTMAPQASLFYSKNIQSFLSLFFKENKLSIQWEDEIIQKTLVIREGKIVNEKVLNALNQQLS
ncbi:NAD(P) transhydrogenase subunit alpha [Methylacidiphilum kamchatkense Kam1]|uniref:proton-translocating NAD(P)(+) transhydrogenase n=1 Tax=Methylacidiphilum kamchatkense Kam1 TaxID=1202785 RepID=A0ABR5A049_9BACT|nr:Re/Si-specific NAD(P)(+) transhydrogenase subunit alpha [Methylacidiphilum kamchatkense]KIE59318.1 NAD(P) transhydrogenase subunit alpha [Methylacidiphilum kamchatkense Kam1]